MVEIEEDSELKTIQYDSFNGSSIVMFLMTAKLRKSIKLKY